MKNIKLYVAILIVGFMFSFGFAGNPDRQGEAGAGELLFNPWPTSSGLHGLNVSSVTGVGALRLNIAGIGRGYEKAVIGVSNSRLYEGSGLQYNALGFAMKMSKTGSFGISLGVVDFGDIPITTVDVPEGSGATFSPSFYNMGIGYCYTYENKISVGALIRIIGESTADVSAMGAAIDAGVQYVSGPQDNFKLGISLGNIGTPMKFGGTGLNFRGKNPDGTSSYELTFQHRAEGFELPSVLNMGVSYDFYVAQKTFVRGLVGFTSNAFSLDQAGGGLEFSFRDLVVLRGAYMFELGATSVEEQNIYSGLSGGFTVNVPMSKKNKNKIALDYSFRPTHRFNGSHNFSARIEI